MTPLFRKQKLLMPRKKSPIANFEKSITELETLVEAMESGDMNLETSLKSFEQGINLTRTCQQALDEAEQKVQILCADEQNLEDFADDE